MEPLDQDGDGLESMYTINRINREKKNSFYLYAVFVCFLV